MYISKKVSYSIYSLIALLTVTACSSNNNTIPAMATINGDVNFSKANLVKAEIVPKIEKVVADNLSKEHVFVDLGNGKKTAASFDVNLNFGTANGFKTKAATNNNGFDGTSTSVKSVRVWLREGDIAFGPVTSNSAVGSNNIIAFNYDRQTAGNPLLTFTNVNANSNAAIAPTSSGNNSYFVAVAAYDDTSVSPTHGGIITANNVNFNGSASDNASAIIATEQAIFATTGGDGANANGVARIHVNANFTVTSFTGLSVALKLKDAVGATIQTDVSFSNGSSTYSGSVTGIGAN